MRGYILIEPNVYSRIGWDPDLIVKCLEVIRLQMHQIIPAGVLGIEYDLIAVSNPHGLPYPAIGMHCPKDSDWNTVPDWPEVDEIVNQWVQGLDFDALAEKASGIKYIDWEQLTRMGTFPRRA